MPIDRGAIDAQLREIGESDRWWEQREFRDLPHILHADEKIAGLTTGKLLGSRRPRLRAARWLMVATSQRLICLRQERFARKQVEIAAGQITRIQPSSRFGSFQLLIDTLQRRYRIRIPKEDAYRFSGALSPLVPERPAQRPGPELAPWSWIPGFSAAAALPGFSTIVSRVAMLSPPDYAPREEVERLETTVERLQGDVERLQQQVAFLEDLLQKRAEDALLPPSSMDAQGGSATV